MAKTLLNLFVTSVVAHTALTGCRITITLYALELHASEATVGGLTALFALFPMFCAVAMGRRIDLIGVELPMLGGACVMAAGCGLALYGAGTLWSLPIAAAAMGLGFMAIHVATQDAVGARSAAHQRAANFSHLAMVYSVAGMVGPVMAGFIIGNAGYRTAFAVFLGLIGLAIGLAGVRYYRRMEPTPLSSTAIQSGAANAFDLLHDKAMRSVYGVGLLIAAAQELFLFMLPLQGVRLGMPASTIGTILGGFAGGTFVIRFGMRRIADRCTEWGILTIAMALVVVCYGVLPFLQTPISIFLLAVVLGFALGSCQPNVLALLHHHAPAGRSAEAVGLRATMGYANQVTLPLVLGLVSAPIGIFAIFWGMAAVTAVCLPYAYRRMSEREHAQLEM